MSYDMTMSKAAQAGKKKKGGGEHGGKYNKRIA